MRREHELRRRRSTPDRLTDAPKFAAPSRGEFVYRVLCTAIPAGKLRAGERLCEESIARALGVSRTPVREALGRLQARGLVKEGPGRGLVVVALGLSQVNQLYAAREVIEGATARHAAEAASEDEIAVLWQSARDCRAAEDVEEMARLDRRFHQTIGAAARNGYLARALGDLRDSLALLRGTTLAAIGRPETAFEEHVTIIRAIERRDPATAEAVARAHVREAHRLRLAMMAEEQTAATGLGAGDARRRAG